MSLPQHRKKTFSTATLGCRVNRYETRALADLLTRHSWHETSPEAAAVLIVNVCAVTQKGSRKSRARVHRLLRSPAAEAVYIMGCMTEEDRAHYEALPGVKAVVMPEKREELALLLTGSTAPFQLETFGDRARAYVKVQDGCDQFCTYCIVPHLRGRSRSRPLDEISSEIERLLEKGIPELWLVGTDLGDWNGGDLPSLVEQVAQLIERSPARCRIRLGTLSFASLTDKLLEVVERYSCICPHLHLSLQSGSQTIRRRMGRKTPPGEILQKLTKWKEAIPELFLSADVMVGFPGETEDDFRATCTLCCDAGLVRLHVFPYSVRSGTRAAGFPCQVPLSVRKKRVRELKSLEAALFAAFIRKRLGSTVDVIVEKNGENGYGVSAEYIQVHFAAEGCIKGAYVTVRIDALESGAVQGTIVQ